MFHLRVSSRLIYASRNYIVCLGRTPALHTSSTTCYPLLERALTYVPTSMDPYVRLARYHSPTGTCLLYLPCTWSIALASIPGHFPDIWMLTLFGIGSVLMRGAGCTLNDLLDKDFDRHVERTKNRPLACGAVSTTNASLFLGLQLSAALFILLQLNWYSVWLGVLSTVPALTYPLFKRFTYWPQFILGLAFNWGALLGYSAVTGHVDPLVCFPLYAAGISWTFIYDTLYAHQDVKYDRALGLKSTAILFGDKTKLCLSLFQLSMLTSLLLVGINSGAGLVYYGGTVVTMLHNSYLLYSTKLEDPASCWRAFRGARITGLLYFSGIVLDKLLTFPLRLFSA
ncbi:unnamed protein product [Calicophoron daubneyi]|uniref:4-hydroxybenzoate polyprenyltransferase, mitochondrial n=1 Tax=Calicophoron daubneyi TaxID=300641 RepID=A0AAV2TGL9_CALDB